MNLVIRVTEQQKIRLQDKQVLSNVLGAALLGKNYELEGKPLLWEDTTTDRTFPFLVKPSEELTSTVILEVVGEAAAILQDYSKRSRLSPNQLAELGVATYLEGLEKSQFCDLIWKSNDRRRLVPKEVGRVETKIFPKTMK